MKLTALEYEALLRSRPALAKLNPVNGSVQQNASVPIGDTRAVAKLERHFGNGALAKSQVEKQNPARVLVCVTSVRRRLIDEDNLSEKAIVDCLRYAGCLRGDESAIAKIEVSQIKAGPKEPEKIIVEIFEQVTSCKLIS